MKPALVAFSARIGSGKSTVSAAIAEQLGWPRASFGDFVRAVAISQGLNVERETLQVLGENLIRSNTEQFCKNVLASANWKAGQGVVLDGLRHQQILADLRQVVSPMPVLLIYLDVPEAVRSERITKRGLNQTDVRRQELHSTEQQVIGSLPALADLRVDSSVPISRVTGEIVTWIRQRLAD